MEILIPPRHTALAKASELLARLGAEDLAAVTLLVNDASAAISTAIGTLMALALVRYQFFGRRTSNLLIVLPMAIPGIVSATLFGFTLTWNEFTYALTFVSQSASKTAVVGVTADLIRVHDFRVDGALTHNHAASGVRLTGGLLRGAQILRGQLPGLGALQ